jgi:hypothetical protein
MSATRSGSDGSSAAAATPATDQAPPLRASDADRYATVHALQDAVARGLLTLDEGSERMASAYAARFLRDLAPLTADLPRTQPAVPAPRAPGWHTVWAAFLAQLNAELLLLRTHGLRSPRTRRALAVALLLTMMFVTVAGLALHGLAVGDHQFHGDFGPRGGFEGR